MARRKQFTVPPQHSQILLQNGVRYWPRGFGDENEVRLALTMCDLEPNNDTLRNYLRPQALNAKQDYSIAAAFINHHAVLVVRSSEPVGDPPITRPEIVIQKHGYIDPNENLQLIHLRIIRQEDLTEDAPDTQGFLAIFKEAIRKRLEYERYVELLQVQASQRVLLHAALKACPHTHRLLTSDCATFALNFLSEILKYYRCEDIINEQEYSRLRRDLPQFIHVQDGRVGESEIESRETLDRSDEVDRSMS